MNLTGKPPLGLKPEKAQKEAKPRKRIRQVSQKRQAYRNSQEGKDATQHMLAVKALPCVICGKPGPSEAHHVIHGRYGSRKSSDLDVIPLCREHHREGPEAIHSGKETWAAKHGPDYGFLSLVRSQLANENS